jgi:four helix bundle protein
MFDFEKLDVYQRIRELSVDVLRYIASSPDLDPYLRDQLRRATLSAVFNLAEGSGRMTKADKKRFYTVARSSVFECVAILNVLGDMNAINDTLYNNFYERYTTVSKMLLAMYRSMTDN